LGHNKKQDIEIFEDAYGNTCIQSDKSGLLNLAYAILDTITHNKAVKLRTVTNTIIISYREKE